MKDILFYFKQRYGASIRNEGSHPLADDDDELFEDQFGIAYNLDREFEPRLKEHMQYCLNHLEEISSGHGEKTQLLVDKTKNLQFQADSARRIQLPLTSPCSPVQQTSPLVLHTTREASLLYAT